MYRTSNWLLLLHAKLMYRQILYVDRTVIAVDVCCEDSLFCFVLITGFCTI
jgi:hypothetical protein